MDLPVRAPFNSKDKNATLRVHSTAFFELLATAAGARVITSHFGFSAANGGATFRALGVDEFPLASFFFKEAALIVVGRLFLVTGLITNVKFDDPTAVACFPFFFFVNGESHPLRVFRPLFNFIAREVF